MRLGPGLLFAGSAVGVSHLVQSTRAGAEFGLTLAPLLVLVCLTKYPMFRFAAEYSAVTGESVVAGYGRHGRWLLGAFLLATVVEGVGVIPAVSLVTAGLAMSLVGIEASDVTATSVVVVGVALVLAIGRYRFVEHIARVFVAVFSVLSVVAALAAVLRAGGTAPWFAELELAPSNAFFLVAVAGWMPIGAGGAAFLSVWVIARANATRTVAQVADTRFDFDLGYLTTVVIALCFLSMGAVLMFGTGQQVAPDSVGFASQLVGLFARSIGQWAQMAVAVAALAIMSSTVLGSRDGFPRVYAATVTQLCGRGEDRIQQERLYVWFLGLQAVAALLLLAFFFRSFPSFIDLVTTIGFFTAPVIACLNHRIMFSADIPNARQPGRMLHTWSAIGVVVLVAVCPVYLYFRWA